MARKLRIQFPRAIYHVMSRGDRREDIFLDDQDRELFIQTLADTCAKTSWQVHAFCLMPNHFHLVVETPQPNLVAGMKWFLGTYTTRFNRRHKITGHVFAGRYKSLLVGGEGGYLRTVCDYVHLNPVRAKLLALEDSIRDFPWSSFGLFLRPASERPVWLRIDRLLGECGITEDNASGRQEFEERLESRSAGELDDEFKPLRSGWCYGNDAFREEMLKQVDGEAGVQHYGAELTEAAEAKARRIIDEELRRVVWTEAELALRKKGDSHKLAIARRLRQETTVTLQWIAAKLHMGTKTHVSHLLYWRQRAEMEGKTDAAAKSGAKAQLPSRHHTQGKLRPATKKPRSADLAAPASQPASPLDNDTIPMTDPIGVGGFDTSFD